MCKLGKDECLLYHSHDGDNEDVDPEKCLGLGRRSFEQFESQQEPTFRLPMKIDENSADSKPVSEPHVEEDPPIVVPKASLASEIAGLIRWNRRKSKLPR